MKRHKIIAIIFSIISIVSITISILIPYPNGAKEENLYNILTIFTLFSIITAISKWIRIKYDDDYK